MPQNPDKSPNSRLPAAAPTPSQTPAVAAPTPSQIAAVVLLVLIYAGLSYYSNSAPNAKGLGAFLSLAPIVLIGAAMIWRWSGPVTASVILAFVVALLFLCRDFLMKYYEWSDLIQQCVIYAFVAFGFGRSLLGDRVPLCTQLMTKLYGPLSGAENSYTRRATVAWTVFYVSLTAAIVTLFFVTSLSTWSFFINFATFGLIGVMFVTDHAIRRCVLPRRPGGILAALRQSLTGAR